MYIAAYKSVDGFNTVTVSNIVCNVRSLPLTDYSTVHPEYTYPTAASICVLLFSIGSRGC